MHLYALHFHHVCGSSSSETASVYRFAQEMAIYLFSSFQLGKMAAVSFLGYIVAHCHLSSISVVTIVMHVASNAGQSCAVYVEPDAMR